MIDTETWRRWAKHSPSGTMNVSVDYINEFCDELDLLRVENEARREQIEVLVECLHQEGVSLADPWMQMPWTETTKDSQS